jgi:hypothetical protein
MTLNGARISQLRNQQKKQAEAIYSSETWGFLQITRRLVTAADPQIQKTWEILSIPLSSEVS